ncbi:hypothetical protein MAPG_07085 [Magnaporthiopsis poae ATCC 64411]|uniref:Spc7 kinetochore protein domain-containing protein n=1 Tax=Magnaporthiopsis poae (strain ATCC 64411 / 73-15) TaxID=644358 RepID=A0A0C4E3R7_MAGP6|nr:hypothetical protein MAPG_07085 [Magnaporthiopsis poae ATCC 64411]
MSTQTNMTVPPAVKRSRKSLGGLPSSRKTLEKENATVDLASTSLAANRKKSRSKSIGPGGLDALKPSNGNRRVSLAAPAGPPPRSILKPTIPVLPEIPPHRPRTSAGRDSDSTKVALRTEEEQQAAAREREERERAELEKDIRDRREARRKSLANRRVSFAAEATLHTFHEIEYIQDSTTSTDSTRRASSQTAASPAPPAAAYHPESDDASEAPSTPPDHVDQGVPESPEDQRSLHQKKRRRSSGVNPLDAHDDTLNSTVYDSGSEDGDDIEEQVDDVSEASDSDGTMMTLDADEVTSGSGVTAGSMSMMSSDSTTSIDEMLRLATQRAGVGAAAREPDENEELIPAFVGWGKRPAATSSHAPQSPEIESSPVKSVHEDESDDDNGGEMEMTRPMGGIVRSTNDDDQSVAGPEDEDRDDDEEDAMSMDMDVSMEMTHALGGIVGKKPSTALRGRAEATMCVDQTMDFTMPMGGIQSSAPEENNNEEELDYDSNEDMSMEMTTVMGGVLATTRAGGGQQSRRRTLMRTEDGDGETMGMDMTVGLGRILPPTQQQDDAGDQSLGDATVGMEMTTALGGIIADSSPLVCVQTPNKTGATSPLRKMTLSHKPASPTRARTPTKKAAPLRERITRTPERSAFNGSGLRRTPERQASPPKKSQQPQTPSKTVASSPPEFIGSKSKSPVRFSSPKTRATPQSSPRPRSAALGVFQQNPATGSTTPLVVLTPQTRRLSGIGADRPGLGSPKIAEILKRRGSIGDAARDFVPGDGLELRRGVKWDDPRILEQELDRQREQERAKEDGRRIMEREADGPLDDKDATLNLKEMIQGLSPKKNPLKGRKSLHVGSAKGLLGKRPTELDDEEEAEEQDGVKRLKNLQGSPVKSIRLQHPPSKEETTGRPTRAKGPQDGLATPTLSVSATKGASGPRSPDRQGRFRNVANDGAHTPVDFRRSSTVNPEALAQEEEDDSEAISLQDFLNLTSIRFMELTTTKRRHTVVPSANKSGSDEDGKADMSFERCVVAGACTVPMLELYQHSCRELKKYISEGRDIVREIEMETLEDNPPLFREYMSATPEFKLLMDNQFKNVKTHARLLSKAMWYEWRMKLQEGLKEGLDRTVEGFESDEQILRKQRELIDSVLPGMVARLESLQREHRALDEAARELADCDPEELEAARERLTAANDDVAVKRRAIAALREDLRESEADVEELVGRKVECLAEIKEAERVREECRGWSSGEIMALKARVAAIEEEHGWAVTGCSGTTVSMTYRREIELVFDPTCHATALQQGGAAQANSNSTTSTTTIDLWYIADKRERDPKPLTPELDFFLQCLRDQLRDDTRTHIPPSLILGMVTAGWAQANSVANHVRSLNLTFPTTVSRTSDDSIAVRSTVFLAALKSKIEIVIDLRRRAAGGGGDGGLDVAIRPRAVVVYGERFNTDKMADFLAGRFGDRVVASKGAEGRVESWGDVIVELHGKLLSGAKQ